MRAFFKSNAVGRGTVVPLGVDEGGPELTVFIQTIVSRQLLPV